MPGRYSKGKKGKKSVKKNTKRSNKKPTASQMAHSLTVVQKAEVKKLVRGPEETKYVSNPVYVYGGLVSLASFTFTPALLSTAWNPSISSTSEIYQLLPDTKQGNDDYTRIGNRISPTKVWVNGQIVLCPPADLSSYDITFHMFCLTARSIKTLANYSSIPITSLLNDGQGNNTDFDGTLSHSLLPVNTDEFTVLHHKKIRFNKVYGYVNTVLDALPGTPGNSQNYPSKILHDFHFNIKTPKTLIYDNRSSTVPVNFAPFLVCGWVLNSANGNTAPVSGTPPTQVVLCATQARVHMRFKDA